VTALQEILSIQLATHDLDVHDFYLLVTLQDTVYMNSPHFLQGLKDSVQREIANISSQELCKQGCTNPG
jgi:hypothetical protein